MRHIGTKLAGKGTGRYNSVWMFNDKELRVLQYVLRKVEQNLDEIYTPDEHRLREMKIQLNLYFKAQKRQKKLEYFRQNPLLIKILTFFAQFR